MDSLGIISSFAFAPARTRSDAPSSFAVSDAILYTSSRMGTNCFAKVIAFAII